MKILALIPARGGSKGVPGKNSKLLGEKPLIAYSIESAMACDQLTATIVSTDDEHIADISRKWGAEVPFLRPSELATDEAKSIDVVIHALDFLSAHHRQFDAVCLLQPTSPFRQKGFIDECITAFKQQQVDTLISVLPVPHEHNPHWVFEPDATGLLTIATGDETIISRRQDLPKAYFRDGSVYITKTSVLLNQQSFFGQTIGYIVSNPEHYVNIDTPEDWLMAESKLGK